MGQNKLTLWLGLCFQLRCTLAMAAKSGALAAGLVAFFSREPAARFRSLLRAPVVFAPMLLAGSLQEVHAAFLSLACW